MSQTKSRRGDVCMVSPTWLPEPKERLLWRRVRIGSGLNNLNFPGKNGLQSHGARQTNCCGKTNLRWYGEDAVKVETWTSRNVKYHLAISIHDVISFCQYIYQSDHSTHQ